MSPLPQNLENPPEKWTEFADLLGKAIDREGDCENLCCRSCYVLSDLIAVNQQGNNKILFLHCEPVNIQYNHWESWGEWAELEWTMCISIAWENAKIHIKDMWS